MDVCTFCNKLDYCWECDMEDGTGTYGYICPDCVSEERQKPYIEIN